MCPRFYTCGMASRMKYKAGKIITGFTHLTTEQDPQLPPNAAYMYCKEGSACRFNFSSFLAGHLFPSKDTALLLMALSHLSGSQQCFQEILGRSFYPLILSAILQRLDGWLWFGNNPFV